MSYPVYDLDADVDWPDGVKVGDWREVKEDDESEDDEDIATPEYVKDVLGFDPDDLFTTNEEHVANETSEERKGPTPSGGDRSVAYFMDKDGKPVDKEEATAVEIVEYKGDKEVGRTYAEI